MRARLASVVVVLAVGAVALVASQPSVAAAALPTVPPSPQQPGPVIRLTPQERAAADSIDRIVVLFMQNNSFDKLFGRWGSVNGDRVDGIADAPVSAKVQVNQDGTPLTCLLMNDWNLLPAAISSPTTCRDTTGVAKGLYPAYTSRFTNGPFDIGSYLPAGAQTCPLPGIEYTNGQPANSPGSTAGGCTRDLVHRFYQEQYQLNGGKMNRYAVGSDAVGLTMGHYNTKDLQTYRYLTSKGAPRYAVADRFFSGVFGGSFANGQWLVSSTLPVWSAAPASMRTVLDSNGMPTNQEPASPGDPGDQNYYRSPNPNGLVDGQLTEPCSTIPVRLLCGDWVVNTTYSVQWPYPPGTSSSKLLPLLTHATIGDRLTEGGVDWGYYTGGWANANGLVGEPGWTNGAGPVTTAYQSGGQSIVNSGGCIDPTANPTTTWPQCPDQNFQYHHQSLNYFYNFSTATAATTANRATHLRDLQEFYDLTAMPTGTCGLKPVSFVQELGEGNQHPGYASPYVGDQQIATVMRAVFDGPCARRTLLVLTYDEFGGSWDHVPPPGQGTQTAGISDAFGPGTRLPSLIVSRELPRSGVDSTSYDLSSIMATITSKYQLRPVNSRDSKVRPVWAAWAELSAQ